jgi:redox-sensitive bicupin YhaK (pirin superfamily)
MHVTRRSADRGLADFGWLKSRHTFSFGDYYDPAHMGFGPLRVINEDRVAPGAGFGKHPHRDMEILSWVLEGTLEHKDSLGTGAKIHPGELQRMTAGTGVTHSEFNGSKTDPVHFLQIWVIPKRTGLPPAYEQRTFPSQELSNQWRLLASGHPRDGAITIHQDIELYGTRLNAGRLLDHVASPGRMLWLQVARGSVEIDGDVFRAGDGAAWSDATSIHVIAKEDAELLLFDMTP